MRARRQRWLCTLGVLAALGCERAGERGPPGAARDPASGAAVPAATAAPRSVGASAVPVATERSAGPASLASGARADGGARCRVMSVSGAASRASAPLAAGDVLERQIAVELGSAAALHLVHSASARQWTISGPARLFACDRGEEEIVLALGSLRTEPGSGVRPGAEVWVSTPFGSLRYSDARAEIRVTTELLKVEVSGGSVWFSPLGGEHPAERQLPSGTSEFPARLHRLGGGAARERCERAASAAGARASELLAPSTQPLGARAREHVRARQAAHSICSSALAAWLAGDAGRALDESRAGYSALAGFERLWRGVPESLAPRP